MAERRMFAKAIIDSDAFLDMPLSTQSLYFHLSMRADDDGFVNNPKKVQRMICCSDDDLKLLVAKSFILCFESGIVVIRHWKMHNQIRGDRHKETICTNEKRQLVEDENRIYNFVHPSDNQLTTTCQPTDNQVTTQVSIGKASIVKDSKDTYAANATEYEPTTESVSLSKIKKTYDYEGFKELYQSKCPSFNALRVLSEGRKRKIKALLNEYSVKDIELVFEKAELSDFLKGATGWTATFDWIIKPDNFLKILEGNYDNKGKNINGDSELAVPENYDWSTYIPPVLEE